MDVCTLRSVQELNHTWPKRAIRFIRGLISVD